MDKIAESREATPDCEQVKSESSKSELSLDRILSEIGGFGLYQILISIATGLALMLSSFGLFNFLFAAAIPEHR